MRKTVTGLILSLALLLGCSGKGGDGIPSLTVQNRWTELEARYSGKPMIVRVNVGLREHAGDPRYAHRLGVSLQLRHPDADGLPTAEEAGELKKVEQRIASALAEKNLGLFALVTTHNGTCELMFYTHEPQLAREKLDTLKPNMEYEPTVTASRDDRWFVFRQYASELLR
jgi:hypothetical protein